MESQNLATLVLVVIFVLVAGLWWWCKSKSGEEEGLVQYEPTQPLDDDRAEPQDGPKPGRPR